MEDARQFATGKIHKPMNGKGETIVPIEDVKALWKVKPEPIIKRNPRRFLRPLLILLLFIEWLADTVVKIVTVIHTAFIDISLALENYTNEPDNKET